MPFTECALPISTHFEPVNFDNRLATLLATGIFYYGAMAWTSDIDPENGRFVWAFPTSSADWAARGVCAATGYVAAGHALVTVDGQRYIKEFAPKPRGSN